MADLIEALFKVRSHKTENWYELFCTAKVDKVNYYEKGGISSIALDLVFDHGS
jgi:hypothetical protein